MGNYSAIDFCKEVRESYSFDDQVVGLDKIAQGAVVREVSREDLEDSRRFRRSELASRLANEPAKSLTLYMDAKDLRTSYVLTDGGVYAASHPPQVVEGGIVFRPLPGSKRKLTVQDEIALLRTDAA